MFDFKLIQKDVDVKPIFEEISKDSSAWFYDTVRQKTIKAHEHTLSIPLRLGKQEEGILLINAQECYDTDLVKDFPITINFLEDFAKKESAQLQRVMIVGLMPLKNVAPHIDIGSYYDKRDRYHLVICSEGKSGMTVLDKKQIMNRGELWKVNNSLLHTAFNEGSKIRVHVIFDLLPAAAL